MKRFLTIAAVAAACTVTASAVRGQSVAGTYAIEYPVRMMVNDQPQQTETIAKVKLVLEQKGDSVVGRWQLVSPREVPAEELRGTVSGNRLRLFGKSNAKMRGMNGEEQALTMTQEYVITIDGEALEGTIQVHPPEGISISGPTRQFTGKRTR